MKRHCQIPPSFDHEFQKSFSRLFLLVISVREKKFIFAEHTHASFYRFILIDSWIVRGQGSSTLAHPCVNQHLSSSFHAVVVSSIVISSNRVYLRKSIAHQTKLSKIKEQVK